MSPPRMGRAIGYFSFPRVSGDEPYSPRAMLSQYVFSPREWG